MAVQRLDLGVTAPAGGCGGDACACAAPAGTSPATASAPAGAEIGVAGMTCEHCVRAVTEEISAIDGVTGVHIDLVSGGVSRVRIAGSASDEAVRAAVAEAGYSVAD